MSPRLESREMLLQPITPDQPCGEDLDGTQSLAFFDTFRVFGQHKPLDSPAEEREMWTPKPPEAPEWREIRQKALEALARSKDLRLLAHLGTAVLRTDGLPAFSDTLTLASQWLTNFWAQTYPVVEENAIARLNALNCFADPMAVVDGLRRLPLVSSRQHGTFSLRDIDLATGQVTPKEGDARPDEERINAAFAGMPLDELTQLQESTAGGVGALLSIDASMREAAGSEATPNFDALSAQLKKVDRLLRAQLALRHGANAAAAAASAEESIAAPAAVGGAAVGPIKSRQDAIRALDAVAAFYRQTEPSSPIPLFLERAKRLVSKDFLEVLADIAPEAVAQARAAGGLKGE